MTAVLLERAPVDDVDDGDDLTHTVCCDETIAYCGVEVAGSTWVSDDHDERLCAFCEIAYEQGWPCPVPGCPGGVRP